MVQNDNGRGRLVRIVLAVALAVVAIRSFRGGKRVTGVLAGVGAGVLGYAATTEDQTLTEPEAITSVGEDDGAERTSSVDSADATAADARLRCAACGDPIVPGQVRGPNADHEIVHKGCMATHQ